jgi:histidinol-phosphate aminotransferase
MSSIERLLQLAFREVPGGFVPFETLERVAARLGLPVNLLAKLDANENVYGPSPRAVAAVKRGQWNLYPDASQTAARQALARYLGVGPENILLFNGGDELIGALCHLFVSPDDNIVEFSPSFDMYRWYARSFRAQVRDVARDESNGYAISVAGAQAAVDDRTKMILLCNPNNPTGTLTPTKDARALLDLGPVVLVDEAYGEFAGESVIPLIDRHDNLVVLRTMSKWAGLAGLRSGYAVGSPAMIDQLWKVKDPFNVNLAAQIATLASVDDAAYLLGNVQRIVAERQRLYEALRAFPFLAAYPSQANFVLARVLTGSAAELRTHLEAAGLLVRLFDKPSLLNALRFTVGKPEHTDRIAAALAAWRPSAT